MKPRIKGACLLFGLCGLLQGQTVSSPTQPATFHVEGTFNSAFDGLPGGVDENGVFITVPRSEITFRGKILPIP